MSPSDDTDARIVSVVVAARNAEAELRDCLASLVRVDYPSDRRELIVVDNGSRDGTSACIRAFSLSPVVERRIGVAWARNAGTAAAHGDIVAFTDPDCLVATSWLRELVRPFADPDVGAVAGGILPFPPATAVERYAARNRSHSELRALAHSARPFGLTPNLAVRRELLSRIGGFDIRFPGGGWEDADLCWRLSAATATRLEHAPRAVVFHRYRTTARSFLVQHYRYGYGLGILRRKYGDEATGRCGPARDLDPRFLYLSLIRLLGQQAGFAVASARSA